MKTISKTRLVSSDDQFLSPRFSLLKTVLAGFIFTLILLSFSYFFWSRVCIANDASCASYRDQGQQMALLFSLTLTLVSMISLKIDRPLFVVLALLVLFWSFSPNWFDLGLSWLIYGLVAMLAFVSLAWLSQLRDWRWSLGIMALVTLFLKLLII